MVYLEKIEITEEYLKYHYFESKGTDKGVLIYFPKTGICRTEKLCEDDEEWDEMVRGHAFVRMMEYVEKNNYPDADMVAWG